MYPLWTKLYSKINGREFSSAFFCTTQLIDIKFSDYFLTCFLITSNFTQNLFTRPKLYILLCPDILNFQNENYLVPPYLSILQTVGDLYKICNFIILYAINVSHKKFNISIDFNFIIVWNGKEKLHHVVVRWKWKQFKHVTT